MAKYAATAAHVHAVYGCLRVELQRQQRFVEGMIRDARTTYQSDEVLAHLAAAHARLAHAAACLTDPPGFGDR